MKIKQLLKTSGVWFAFAVFTYLYYWFKTPLTLVAAGLVLGYIFYTKEEIQQGEKLFKFLFWASIIFMTARFIRIFDLPLDFFGDEQNVIVDSWYFLKGGESFFEYNIRYSTSFPYLAKAVVTAILLAVKENIFILALIPALISVLTALCFYLLGKEIRDEKTGVLMLFLYASSSWALFLGRIMLENIYIPLFAALYMFMFFRYLKTKKPVLLALMALVMALAFYTYSSWLIFSVFALYLAVEYRKEAGRVMVITMAAVIIISFALYIYQCFLHPEAFNWARQITAPDKTPVFKQLYLRLAHTLDFFIAPVSSTQSYSQLLPAFSFVEFIALAGGVVAAVMKSKEKSYRVFLVGFVFAVSTLLISREAAHHVRHMLIIPFAAVLSAFFIHDYLLKSKLAIQMIAAQLLLFCASLGVLFVNWEKQINLTDVYRQAATYINGQKGYVKEISPYGMPQCVMRTKQAYNFGPVDAKAPVFIVAPAFLSCCLEDALDYKDKKLFTDPKREYDPGIIVYTLAGADEDILALLQKTDIAAKHMWRLRYKQAVEEIKNIKPDRYDMPVTSFYLTYCEDEAFLRLRRMESLRKNINKNPCTPPDIYMSLSDAYAMAGLLRPALGAVEDADRNSCGWKRPAKRLEALKIKERYQSY